MDEQGAVTAENSGELRLAVELVPRTSWYRNLRSMIPAQRWDGIRHQVYADAGRRCEICGGGGSLEAHEVWRYADEALTQSLVRFQALCAWCHHVKHLGLAGKLAEQGELDYERVVAHFCAVNGCDRAAFEKHKREAFARWRARSRFPWTVDLGPYAALTSQAR